MPRECRLCRLLTAPEHGDSRRHEILLERDGFAIVLGLGAQTEGYLLLVSQQHRTSCAELPPEALRRLEEMRREVRHLLSQVYEPCVFLEHGPGQMDSDQHLHIHALPTTASVVDVARKEHNFVKVGGLPALSAWDGRPYLAIWDQRDHLHVADVDTLREQYPRRLIAEAIGCPSEWDYRAYPQHARLRRAAETLGPLLRGMESARRELVERDATRPKVFIARAVDNRGADVAPSGESLAARLTSAGFLAVDPVVQVLPHRATGSDSSWYSEDVGRVESNLQWLRRCDALVVDMQLPGWTYIGCVCELVYAYQWRMPIIVIAPQQTADREWLRYHATRRVGSVDEAIEGLQELLQDRQAGAR